VGVSVCVARLDVVLLFPKAETLPVPAVDTLHAGRASRCARNDSQLGPNSAPATRPSTASERIRNMQDSQSSQRQIVAFRRRSLEHVRQSSQGQIVAFRRKSLSCSGFARTRTWTSFFCFRRRKRFPSQLPGPPPGRVFSVQ